MMIKYFKLVSGEDVIAQVETASSPDFYKLKNPILILSDGVKVGFSPFSLFGKADVVEVNKIHVIWVDDPDEEIYNAYNAKYGTGIVTTTSNFKLYTPNG